MTTAQTIRLSTDPRVSHRRRLVEVLTLVAASVAFIFTLAIAIGLISG